MVVTGLICVSTIQASAYHHQQKKQGTWNVLKGKQALIKNGKRMWCSSDELSR